MLITQKAVNLIDECSASFTFPEANECPICHAKIVGQYISSVVWYKAGDAVKAAVVYFCPYCTDCFIVYYAVKRDTGSKSVFNASKILSAAPMHFEKHVFDEKINTLSPMFDEIYNQAKQAETLGLDQIAGIGYRKSIEFLVKDFAKKNSPKDESTIKTMPLSACINTYIDDTRIKTLAEKATWLGNDETHYLRKHTDRDINDMKKFIEAMVYFISMFLIYEDATTIQKA